jgi:hypothetical protein
MDIRRRIGIEGSGFRMFVPFVWLFVSACASQPPGDRRDGLDAQAIGPPLPAPQTTTRNKWSRPWYKRWETYLAGVAIGGAAAYVIPAVLPHNDHNGCTSGCDNKGGACVPNQSFICGPSAAIDQTRRGYSIQYSRPIGGR